MTTGRTDEQNASIFGLAGKPVDAMAWLLVLVPETAQCEGLQEGLSRLAELKVES